MYDLRAVRVEYGAVEALAPIDLVIGAGDTVVLLGPSGSGKSTLLRTLAGLTPYTGELRFEDAPVDNWRMVRRRLGYVIQDGGLFPHLNARDNVTLVARELKWERGRIAERIDELAALVGLDAAQLDRFPAALSGGQRQRVAMMRALMLDPAVLLLDEPLSALDPITRVRLAGELREIIARLEKTVVIVTHNLAEARHFGGHQGGTAVLMNQGRVIQRGSVADLRDAPAEPFVTEFLSAEEAL